MQSAGMTRILSSISLLLCLNGFAMAFLSSHRTSNDIWCKPGWKTSFSSRSPASLLYLARKKNKLSFAEKQKRRASKRVRQPPVPSVPANLDQDPKFLKGEETVATEPSQPSTKQPDSDAPNQRARELIEAQRKSVSMLTLVKERVESLPSDDIVQALASQGYFVWDGLLQDDSVISELEQEGASLLRYDQMELDVKNIGSGEYVTSIEGGEEQYNLCPRSTEFTVSVTRHMPPKLGSDLDPSASMGSMRTYDRKARMASISLLTGEEEDTTVPQREFGLVTEDDDPNESRKVTLLYYIVPEEWDAECGAGVTFKTDQGESVEAKRDRLIILKSDKCLHRKAPWKGREGLEIASCIELHLVNKS